MDINLKPLRWVASSREDLKKMPLPVQREIGFALHQVQEGKMPQNAKALKGIGSGVFEIISDNNKNTYRAVYVIKLDDYIYVLHAFQKKSKHGIATPKQDVNLIKQRLAAIKNKEKNK